MSFPVTVTRATPAPTDSHHSKTGFERGAQGLQEYLDALWQANGERYVGEWHSHPGGSGTPSSQDLHQMRQIAADAKYACPTPALVVVGLGPGRQPEVSVQVSTEPSA
ncbi:MAG: hypothetical protein GF320_03410 [Armatimonadia bacterium]|nr:hypothetical protein [Armatimonadia bacterium]